MTMICQVKETATEAPASDRFLAAISGAVQSVVEQEVQEYREALAEAERQLLEQGADGTVAPLRLENGLVYGTMHRAAPGVMATAWHVTEGLDISGLVEEFGPCWRIEQTRMASFHDGQYADAHLFGDPDAVEAFKASCPSIEEVGARLMMQSTNDFYDAPGTSFLALDGYPAGQLTGAPQRRYFSPYTLLDTPGGLYAGYSSLDPSRYIPGTVIGGYSGGRARWMDQEVGSMGVVVRAGPLPAQDREIAVVQPFHNEMSLIGV